MSHIMVSKNFVVKDLDSLLKAVTQLEGLTIEETTTVEMYGRQKRKCLFTIKIPGMKYPIGITNKGEVLHDFYLSEPKGRDNFNRLANKYNEIAITKQARKNGFRIKKTIKEDNSVLLVLTK